MIYDPVGASLHTCKDPVDLTREGSEVSGFALGHCSNPCSSARMQWLLGLGLS